MFRTLYAKLVLALLALLGLIGVLYLSVTLFMTQRYVDEVHQKLNRDVAEHLVSEVVLIEEGQVNEKALKEVFHMMMVINPSIEIYLLDVEGQILAFSAPPGKVKAERIALEPMNRFLESDGNVPILGDDPRHPDRQKAFSAATIQGEDGLEGYLYVVLGGEQYDSAVEMLRGSYILRMGTGTVAAGLLIVLAAGLFAFYVMTRRVGKLSSAMEAFQDSDFTEPVDVQLSRKATKGDEIDGLGNTFQRMSDRMMEQLSELKQADSLRRELVANVSHDLRTPLASLQGYLETLLIKEATLSDQEKRHYLEISLRHSDRLGTLVSELFELAKLESAETRPVLEPFAPAELVQDVVQKNQLDAEKKGVSLRARVVEHLPFVLADIGLIERVLENLIDNALRFTPKGGSVDVAVERSGDSIAVSVSDTGCGIPPEDLPHVFDRFYRMERDDQRSTGGAGLGLAIAGKIMELHESSIEASSTLGEGSSFRFSLHPQRM